MTMPLKKIVIVGPGAMGCLFAGMLQSSEREIWLLDKDPERAAILNNQGINILREEEKIVVSVKATADPSDIGPADLVIFCVKSYDTKSAAIAASKAAGEKTKALTLQNGTGNVETLAEVFGADMVMGGTTAQGANLVDTGKVRHAGAGETVVGELSGGTGRAEEVASLFNSCGLPARATKDISSVIWSKLVINVAINALTAILGVRNGALAETEAARQIMADAVNEVVAISNKKGIELMLDDPLERAIKVAQATARNISSMLQDVRAKRGTEIDSINGAVAREAAGLGISAPVNLTLTRLVKSIEETYEKKL